MPVSADCYLLCIMMALDTETILYYIFLKFERTTQIFVLYLYMQTLQTCQKRCVLCSYALIYYIVQ